MDNNGQFNNQQQMPPQGFNQQPQFQPQQPQQQPYGAPGAKSSVAAGLLGLFLGAWGAHDFYLGYKKNAIIHVILGGGGIILGIIGAMIVASSMNLRSLLTGSTGWQGPLGGILSWIGWLAVAGSAIWGIVGGVMCLTKSGQYSRDANGNMLI